MSSKRASLCDRIVGKLQTRPPCLPTCHHLTHCTAVLSDTVEVAQCVATATASAEPLSLLLLPPGRGRRLTESLQRSGSFGTATSRATSDGHPQAAQLLVQNDESLLTVAALGPPGGQPLSLQVTSSFKPWPPRHASDGRARGKYQTGVPAG